MQRTPWLATTGIYALDVRRSLRASLADRLTNRTDSMQHGSITYERVTTRLLVRRVKIAPADVGGLPRGCPLACLSSRSPPPKLVRADIDRLGRCLCGSCTSRNRLTCENNEHGKTNVKKCIPEAAPRIRSARAWLSEASLADEIRE